MLHRQTGRVLSHAARHGRLTVGLGEVAGHWRSAGWTARAALDFARDADTALAEGSFEIAITLYAAAEAEFAQLPLDRPRLALVRAGFGLAAWGMGNVRSAIVMARSGMEIIEQTLGQGHAPWKPRPIGQIAGNLRYLAILVAGWHRPLPPRLRLALHRNGALRAETGFFKGSLHHFAMGGLICWRLADNAQGRVEARVRGLASLAVLLGLLRLPRLALAVGRRCQALEPNGRGNISRTAAEAIWRLASGEWQVADVRLTEAEQLLGDPPDPQQLGGILVMRALMQHMRGELDASLATYATLDVVGTRAGNVQFQAWALYGAAMPLLAMGRSAEAESRTIAAQGLLVDNEDLLSDLNCHALRAQAAMARAASDEALRHAGAGISLGRGLFAGNFGSLEGFATPALITGRLLASSDPELAAQAAAMFPAAMKLLNGYCRICRIGLPRRELALAWASSRNSTARRHAARSLAHAEVLGMPLDRALAQKFLQKTAEATIDGRLSSAAW
jgi:hypothetical protein